MKNSNWKETKILKNKYDKYTANPDYGIGSYLVTKLVIEKLNLFFKNGNKPKRILDVGCGYMPHYIFFKDSVETPDYVGIDWGNSPHKNSNVDYYIDLNKPFYISDLFDYILLMDVIEHVTDVSILFESLKKCLNNNGNMFITVPFFYWIHEAPYDFNRYTIYQLKNLLNKNGLEIIEYEIIGGFGLSLIDLISKNILRPLRLNNFIVRKLLYLFYLIFNKIGLNKNKDSYPIEYILKIGHL